VRDTRDKLREVSNRVNTPVASAYMCSYLVPARSLTRTTDLLACSAADACRMRKRERERERQEKGHLACTLRASRSRKSVRDIGSNWETGAGKIQRWNKFPTKISAYALFARLAARMDTHTLHTRAALNMRKRRRSLRRCPLPDLLEIDSTPTPVRRSCRLHNNYEMCK